MAKRLRRREGFAGQHLVVLPAAVVQQMERNPATQGLFPVATGYFPRAPGHYVERAEGLDDFILIVCLSGKGWLQLGSQRWELGAGEAAGIPAKLPHAYGANAMEPWSIMWVHCRGTELASYAALLGIEERAPILRLPPGVFDRIEFAGIYQTLEHGHAPVSLVRASARLRLVLAELAYARLPPNARSRPADESLQQSLDWMHLHFRETVMLPGLARRAGLSVPHYAVLFRKKTGCSPLAYLQRLKVQHACQLLDTTSLPISQVAEEVGFADPYHFSRAFKKIMACSPRDFRQVKKG